MFPPLGLGIIAALTPENYDITLIDENFDEFEYIDADLVGITVLTSAAVRAYELSEKYRSCGVPVVLGGIHVSMMPDEADRYADAVVCGEAETVWRQLISDFENGILKSRYNGTHEDLSGTVVPRRDLFHPGYNFGTIQTSRGCPMNCNFCSVTVFNGSRYRQRPVNEVLDELETIPQKLIFFIDDNIVGYGREAEGRAIALFKGMVARGIRKSWFCQASVNFGSNPELLKWAAESGCRMVFIGLEALDESELSAMNKKMNIRFEYDQAFKNIHRAGIAVLGAFIFGTDSDTEKSIVEKTRYIECNPIDVIQITTLTPLPGTRLFREFRQTERLIYTDFPSDWMHYDMTELTFEPAKISSGEFIRINILCQRRLLGLLILVRKFFSTMIKTRSVETALWAFNSNLVYRKAFRLGLKYVNL